MNILKIAQSRHTSKAYDASQKIPKQQLDALLEVLRLTPSSINIQPWVFLVAQSDDAKHKIAQAMPQPFEYNIPKVLNASEVIIFTAKRHIDEQHLDQILQTEVEAGRFRTIESQKTQKDMRLNYVHLYQEKQIIDQWVNNQIHIALGGLLIAAKAEGIDATPIGGFDADLLDQALDLEAKGLRSVVIASLGYHSQEDFNATLAKARLPYDDVIEIF